MTFRTQEAEPYAAPLDHLADELRWLDAVVHLATLRNRTPRPENPLEALMGLVVSDEEIDMLLSRNGDPVAETASMRRLGVEAGRLRDHIDARRKATAGTSAPLPLDTVAQLFSLSTVEERCLLVCLAPELDRKYGKLFAYLQDDVMRKRPSLDLIATLLGNEPGMRLQVKRLLLPLAPLVKHHLVALSAEASEAAEPLLLRGLRIDERVIDFVHGSFDLDARLTPFCRLAQSPHLGNVAADPGLVERLQAYLSSQAAAEVPIAVHLRGPEGTGRRALAAVATRALGRRPLWVDAERQPAAAAPAQAAFLVVREAHLQGAIPCIDNFDAWLADDERSRGTLAVFVEALRLYQMSAVLIGVEAWAPQGELAELRVLDVTVERPSTSQRLALWQRLAVDSGIGAGADVVQLAGAFRLTPRQIGMAIADAGQRARWRDPAAEGPTQDDLLAACRALSAPDLLRLAKKIEPKCRWHDIVLPPATLEQLQELCSQARHRPVVMGDWGFDAKLSYGKGIAALFSGPPGTGKTMAAEIIAGDLGVDLYKIDLSQVISKFIGETEKNLDRVFSAAQDSNAILFFDEADALFGKRSEVRDSHDRYANVEISYLLQKMEEYDGLAILATNMRQHLDEAFLRRLRSITEFPFPDADLRRGIWAVTFPLATPLADDVDFARLARDVRLAGGGIKNIALNAAALAVADGSAVAMRHLVRAARREHDKVGRKWTPSRHLLEAVP